MLCYDRIVPRPLAPSCLPCTYVIEYKSVLLRLASSTVFTLRGSWSLESLPGWETCRRVPDDPSSKAWCHPVPITSQLDDPPPSHTGWGLDTTHQLPDTIPVVQLGGILRTTAQLWLLWRYGLWWTQWLWRWWQRRTSGLKHPTPTSSVELSFILQ